MTRDEILEKTRDGANTVRDRVRSDLDNWTLPVKIEPDVWRDWTSRQLGKRGFASMAIQCRKGRDLRAHALQLAFEILAQLGWYETPLLCIPELLDRETEADYYRAIAIAKNSKQPH